MEIRSNVPLAPFTTFGIGGPALWFAEAHTEDEVAQAVAFARERKLRLFLLGGGSNLLVADEGFPGLVLRIAMEGVVEERVQEESGDQSDAGARCFRAGAGESWDGFVALTLGRGYGGLECLSGIPGSVGGTPVQNVGAYGQEVSQTIEGVRALDLDADAWTELSNAECRFAYRQSLFNTAARGRYIITRVDFRLEPAQFGALLYPDLKRYFKDHPTPPTLLEVRNAVLAIREQKGMLLVAGDLDCRSAGSFFRNAVVAEAELARIAAAAVLPLDQVPPVPSRGGSGKGAGCMASGPGRLPQGLSAWPGRGLLAAYTGADQPWQRDSAGRPGAARSYPGRGKGQVWGIA